MLGQERARLLPRNSFSWKLRNGEPKTLYVSLWGSGSHAPAGGGLLYVTCVNLLMRSNLSLLAQNLPMAHMSLGQSQSPYSGLQA